MSPFSGNLIALLEKFIRVFFREEKWNIGVLRFPIHKLLDDQSVASAKWMEEQKGNGFVADPFGLISGSKLHILFEQVPDPASNGVISSVEFDGTSFTQPEVRMTEDVHMSYPYVFNHNGQSYCIPETCELNKVILHKANDFPHSWSKQTTLLQNFGGVDNTVFHYKGKWWMMSTSKEGGGADRQLFIYVADELHSEWKPHAQNPVKNDLASARPAGTPFVHDKKLYRPSQDSSRTYGGRVVINEIITLTPTEYQEKAVCYIEPDSNGPYPHGLHTVSSVGNYTLIDGKRFRYSFVKPFKVLFRLLFSNTKKS